jgi:hypothetical protein
LSFGFQDVGHVKAYAGSRGVVGKHRVCSLWRKCFNMFYNLPQRCFFMWVAHSVLRGGNSISVHTHTRLHRLGTNCCFRRVPRNFIKSIGDYKLVLSCVCWLILPPLTVISLHTSTIETQQLLHHHPTGWIIPVEGAERELPKTWPHGFAILGYLRYPPRTRVSQSWLLNT